MVQNPSKKHHYLPRFYLKGFTDSEGGFFVYNKQTGKIFSTSPDDFFFENNLNTVKLPNGYSSNFLEEFYTEIEKQSQTSLDSVRNSTHKTPIKLLDKMNLFLFLLVLHLRLPSNIDFVKKLSDKFFQGNNELDYFKIVSKTDEKVPKEFVDTIKKSSAFKKVSKLILPFAPFYKDNNWGNFENCRFLYTGDEKSWYIVGDNPIITKGDNDHDPVNCLNEFIFPVSGNIILINKKNPVTKNAPSSFVIDQNAAVFERSKRFVACQNKGFLEALIKYYKLHVQFKQTGNIITNIFKMLE